MTVLKPAAESRFSVCCVLAQPTVSAKSAMAPIRLNPVNICFIAFSFFLVSYLVWGLKGDRDADHRRRNLNIGPRQRIRFGRGKDGCKQPKTEAYMCEKMCDFSSFSSERAN